MQPFQLLLKPVSSNCNAACKYCFYRKTPHLVSNPLKKRMADALLRLIIRKYLALRFPENTFIWQGGEPTLAGLEFFKRVAEFQEAYGENQSVCNAIQTNGLLIDEDWARFFKEFHFQVGISLDGPRHIHENARGSFDRVIQAIELLRTYEVPYNILCVLHSDNVNHIEEIYAFLKDYATFIQFIPALDNDIDNRPAKYSISADQYARALCTLFDLWKNVDSTTVSIQLFDTMINKFLGHNAGLCTLQPRCPQYLVIESGGEVFPCDFFVRSSTMLGNITDISFKELLQRRQEVFGAKKVDLDEECVTCKWLRFCYGGCTKDREYSLNQFSKRSYFCQAYKRFFEHTYQWFEEKSREIMRVYY
ncbi:MAG: anaerobic sulfatase maturase [Candidatus Thorarchaeota archaeon]